ncbi:hypothetical protein C2E21_7806 [Chlorella sorokiniana]|uniref:EF-hand domain-containing protein n=1 Tax=Chlorella sorokiniana TaxID=3076 RepID=A0A2P6TGH0_CHLSO|nr:hypothetical protein C2E21_7806 [Chlorella sorokiniana]|eukprot:PRW33206.1 hypothetical protein C2E21_7806 [Chlorella sorokiniana]
MHPSSSLRVPVEDLLKAAEGSASLAKRVHEADSNGDGELSRDEVFASELRARRSKKRLTWALVATAAACVLLLEANTGLNYAVVALSKDTSVNYSGQLVAKDSGEVIKTGEALLTTGLEPLLWLNPSNVSKLHSVTLSLPGGGVAWHQITGASAWPGNRTVLYSASGWRVVVTDSEVALEGPPGATSKEETVVALSTVGDAAGTGSGNGRRLQQVYSCTDSDLNRYIDTACSRSSDPQCEAKAMNTFNSKYCATGHVTYRG